VSAEQWVPTRGGETYGYLAEFKNIKDKWEQIPVVRSVSCKGQGVPYPLVDGGILQAIWLWGLAQAEVIAAQWRAQADAEGATVETRIVKYEIKYDIKARRMPLASE
jgi:hypothetical protein